MAKSSLSKEIEHAIEVFVRGFSAQRNVTHPYLCHRVGELWVTRDGPRKNPRDYRKEEWIAYGVEPREVDRLARSGGAGILPVLSPPPLNRRFFVCAMSENSDDDRLRDEYKQLGYRLMVPEPLFAHRLKRIPRIVASVAIEQVKTSEMAEQFGKATRSRPIPPESLGTDAPFRQYVALENENLVGWVRSIDACDSTWCANMYVRPTHRRCGIGSALLAHMLRDDRKRGAKQSVLLSSHTGALVYPRVGYEQIGMLYIFAPKK